MESSTTLTSHNQGVPDKMNGGLTASTYDMKSALAKLDETIQVIAHGISATEDKSGCHPVAIDGDKRYYSTKTPYIPPPEDYVLSSPPDGYKPRCVQVLARHGSRTITKDGFAFLTLEIWNLAKQKDMLTPLGEELKRDTELYMQATYKIGLGEITQLGKDEHIAMGKRLYHRMESLFTPSSVIRVLTSEKHRAINSAEEFLIGLTECQPNMKIIFREPNPQLLRFHKICAEYIDFVDNDMRLKEVMNVIKNFEQTRTYSQRVLRRIYKEEFVQSLINGNYPTSSFDNVEPIVKHSRDNEVDVVMCLYAMFSVSLNLAEDDPYAAKMFVKYFTLEESEWFAYIADAQDFYVKGPTFREQTVTYDMARPLLGDFFASINACIEDPNNNVTACLRFAHAETVFPLAVLLHIPGLTAKAVGPNEIYTYENNPWRGEKVAPMAANIQFEIYRHDDEEYPILIRMLYNEKEIRFKKDCESITPDSFFYDFNEVKRAYTKALLRRFSEMD